MIHVRAQSFHQIFYNVTQFQTFNIEVKSIQSLYMHHGAPLVSLHQFHIITVSKAPEEHKYAVLLVFYLNYLNKSGRF